jgi:hypothetical protein
VASTDSAWAYPDAAIPYDAEIIPDGLLPVAPSAGEFMWQSLQEHFKTNGLDIDQRADLFALGVIVYEMLSGMSPFEGSGVEIMMANMTCDPPSIAERAGLVVDPALEAFARRLMARDRDSRFASAREALEVLELVDRDRTTAERRLGMTPAPTPVMTMPTVVERVVERIVVESAPVSRARRWMWPTIIFAIVLAFAAGWCGGERASRAAPGVLDAGTT